MDIPKIVGCDADLTNPLKNRITGWMDNDGAGRAQSDGADSDNRKSDEGDDKFLHSIVVCRMWNVRTVALSSSLAAHR